MMGSHTCTERPGHYTKPFITENMVISMVVAMVINKMMMVVSLMMPVMMVMMMVMSVIIMKTIIKEQFRYFHLLLQQSR